MLYKATSVSSFITTENYKLVTTVKIFQKLKNHLGKINSTVALIGRSQYS